MKVSIWITFGLSFSIVGWSNSSPTPDAYDYSSPLASGPDTEYSYGSLVSADSGDYDYYGSSADGPNCPITCIVLGSANCKKRHEESGCTEEPVSPDDKKNAGHGGDGGKGGICGGIGGDGGNGGKGGGNGGNGGDGGAIVGNGCGGSKKESGGSKKEQCPITCQVLNSDNCKKRHKDSGCREQPVSPGGVNQGNGGNTGNTAKNSVGQSSPPGRPGTGSLSTVPEGGMGGNCKCNQKTYTGSLNLEFGWCQTRDPVVKKFFCYVDANSGCSDKTKSTRDLNLYYSFLACDLERIDGFVRPDSGDDYYGDYTAAVAADSPVEVVKEYDYGALGSAPDTEYEYDSSVSADSAVSYDTYDYSNVN